jgi:hypothetical protein
MEPAHWASSARNYFKLHPSCLIDLCPILFFNFQIIIMANMNANHAAVIHLFIKQVYVCATSSIWKGENRSWAFRHEARARIELWFRFPRQRSGATRTYIITQIFLYFVRGLLSLHDLKSSPDPEESLLGIIRRLPLCPLRSRRQLLLRSLFEWTLGEAGLSQAKPSSPK